MEPSVTDLVIVIKNSNDDEVGENNKVSRAKMRVKMTNSKNLVKLFLTKSKSKNMIQLFLAKFKLFKKTWYWVFLHLELDLFC